ncbi:chemotaxis protein CheW [Bacteriovoracaceae bacterium]|nr:chemotaxis protein CheW [Bacteriovoracaceae bacterium]
MSEFCIVCIDDNEDALVVYEALLQSTNNEIHLFESPYKALTFIREHKKLIVMVLCDAIMPEMMGLEVRRKILDIDRDIPFALITGQFDTQMAHEALSLKIDRVLEKPFNENDLEFLVKRYVSERKTVLIDEQEMIQGFAEESIPLLEEIEGHILSLEITPKNVEALNAYFRILHTVKGTSACVGLHELSEYSHKYEDLVSDLKQQKCPITKSVITVLLKGLDQLRTMFANIRQHKNPEYNLEELVTIFNLDYDKIKQEEVEESIIDKGKDLKSKDKKKENQVEKLGVTVTMLDDFMEMSGEMTIVRNNIFKSLEHLGKKLDSKEDLDIVANLLIDFSKVSGKIQKNILEMRKIDVTTVFRPLRRIIRDVCTSTGKKIQFDTFGDDLKIDNSIAKLLNGCLVHLLRNSVDHGIESKEDRVRSGKNEEGKLELHVLDEGEFIYCTIQDDGKGIDVEVIKKKAIENELASPEKIALLSKQEILSFIFESGFSTKEVVTDISGRGVGMDMVKSSITQMNGSVTIHSEVGIGSTFTLKIPKPRSVLIIKALHVEGNEHSCLIPTDDILRIIGVREHKHLIYTVKGQHLFQFDSILCSLIDIDSVLTHSNNHADHIDEDHFLVILRSSNTIYGLVCKKVYDIEEIVQRKFSKELRKIDVLSGVTIIGDGDLNFVLNIEGLAKRYSLCKNVDISEEESHLDQQKIATNQIIEALVFDIFIGYPVAVRSQNIIRIEDLRQYQVQNLGEVSVINYFGEVLPLIDIFKYFMNGEDNTMKKLEDDMNPVHIVVVSYEDTKYGLVIGSYDEIISTQDELYEVQNEINNEKNQYLEGCFYHKKRTVSLLSLEKIINKNNTNKDRMTNDPIKQVSIPKTFEMTNLQKTGS